MSEFTFLFRGRDTSASSEQMQKTMEKWVAWMRDLGAKGHIKDLGHPLELTGTGGGSNPSPQSRGCGRVASFSLDYCTERGESAFRSAPAAIRSLTVSRCFTSG